MYNFNPRSSKGASLASVYILETELVLNSPSASLSPALWMLSSCRKLVLNAVPYTIHPSSSLDRTLVRYSIGSVSLFPPYFKCATTRMRLRASLHWVFSAPMCSLKKSCESHHSLRNFVDYSTGRSVSLILNVGVSGLCIGVQWNVQLYIYGLQTWTHSLLPIPVWHLLPAVGVFLWCQGSAHDNRSSDHPQRVLWRCPWQ